MRITIITTIFFMTQMFAHAQKDWDIPSGQNAEPFVANDQAKIYNRLNTPLSIYVRYEDGAWQEQILKNGYAIYELDICGKPTGTNCNVTVRIYSTKVQYREVNLTGGSRYLVVRDDKSKQYYFEEVR